MTPVIKVSLTWKVRLGVQGGAPSKKPMSEQKPYSIKLLQKTKKTSSRVFDEDPEETEDGKRSILPHQPSLQEEKRAKQMQQQAIEQDQLVFDYDATQVDSSQVAEAPGQSSGSKYIHRLLQSSQNRRLEREQIMGKRDREKMEAEGSLYQDKEQFITPGYQRHLDQGASIQRVQKMHIPDPVSVNPAPHVEPKLSIDRPTKEEYLQRYLLRKAARKGETDPP